ncbi:MAG: DUF924 family protein [Pseudomonadota bacterium]
MPEVTPKDVVTFWVDEVGPDKWYKADDAVDAEIRKRFGDVWQTAAAGGLRDWKCGPSRTLAYLLVTDQFPRNMFRDEARSFQTDRQARSAAMRALAQGWDVRVAEPQRQFFYLPMVHSEVLEDQERGLRLVLTRLSQRDGSVGRENLLHARAHREVIRRFGRFPHRNACLGRPTSGAEATFLSNGGYGAVVRQLQAAA